MRRHRSPARRTSGPAYAILFMAGVALVVPSVSHAQGNCAPISALEVTPADDAQGVARDGLVRVRFAEGTLPSDSPAADHVALRDADGALVEGIAARLGPDTILFSPTEPLDSLADYTVEIDDGAPVETGFRTGSLFDQAPPSDAPILRARAADASCDEDVRRVSLSLSPASDDGPLGSLEYFVYLTRGAGLTAPRLVARHRNFNPFEVSIGFVLERDALAEPICLEVHVVDGALQRTVGEPRCFDPVDFVAFDTVCSAVAPGGTSSSGRPFGWIGVLLVVLGLRLRRWTPRARAW